MRITTAAVLAASLMAPTTIAQVCVAQAVWTKKTSQTDPTIKVASAMAYDAKRGNTVLYGNRSRPETWVWNGTSWKLVATTGPSAKLNR